MPKARRRVRIKTPPLLFDATQRVISRIQRSVDGAFLTYWTSTSGSVCDNDVMALHELLQALGPPKQLTLFVKSDGGSGMAAVRLVHLLRGDGQTEKVGAPLNGAAGGAVARLAL